MVVGSLQQGDLSGRHLPVAAGFDMVR